MRYQLYTLNGRFLLDHIRINMRKKSIPTIDFNENIVLTQKKREDCALFYHLGQVLKEKITTNCAEQFEKFYFYVDFSCARPIDKEQFSRLFNDGFHLDFGDNAPIHYVPFLTSQSQSKKFVYTFVAEEVFTALRPILDLDIPFEEKTQSKSLAFLSKLYAYRALYLSSATEVLRYSDDKFNFFNCENIIVLPEKTHNPENAVPVFTATAANELSDSGEAFLTQEETSKPVSITCFDGEGLISPGACKIINSRVKSGMRGNSFQIRMPFLKGVLHNVDFHKFLRDKGIKGEKATIIDAFGRERDLFKANIIIRPSVFKLYGLLKSLFPSAEARDEYFKAFVPDGDIMKYYFEKIALYNHGLYVVKSEKSFHNTDFVRLSSQQISTFDLKPEDFDGIVRDHIELADAFCEKTLSNPEKRNELLKIEDKADWMELLLKEERFLKDPHIRSIIAAHRVSRYNDIALGKLLVRGENRFLSGDLYVFLVDMLGRVTNTDAEFSYTYEALKREGKLLSKNGVYMPGVAANGQKVALVRSPHLSRNEDVCTIVKTKGDYDKYLGHLTGVVITGDTSYIPAALGGADFDGDHISIIYDRRIIDACFKSGYVEISKTKSPSPFIKIEEIKAVLPKKAAKIRAYNYVCPQVVYTTFSNRIGQISNTAMKIAAVEYDLSLDKSENLPKAAFCTILTGNEIDATKKGIRPFIDDVQNFSKNLDAPAKQVVKEVEDYIKMKRELEAFGGTTVKIINEDGLLKLDDKNLLPIKTFNPNLNRNPVTQLLYRWANAFYNFKAKGSSSYFAKKNYNVLKEIFPESLQNEKLCQEILSAYILAKDKFFEACDQIAAAEKTTADIVAKITVRLKGQYDNIYYHAENEPSIKDSFDIFQNQLFNLTKNIEKSELEALNNYLYSVGKDKFNPKTFWAYTKGQNAKENRLLSEILSLPFAKMLLNFDFEGYRLLHYAIKNAIYRKHSISVPQEIKENIFASRYFNFCLNNTNTSKTKDAIADRLTDVVRADLANAEAVDVRTEDGVHSLISRLYPLDTKPLINAFWEIFSVNQVIDALGGDVNA